MSDFRVHTMKRYRHRQMKDDKYTLQCPTDISCMDPDAEVPVRQRGGVLDNQVFFARVGDLEPDESRDRRHNMDAQAKLKRSYGHGLHDGSLVWLHSVHMSEVGHTVTVVSLADSDFVYREVEITDLLCRPDRVSRKNSNVVVTLVGPTYADGRNRRGNELLCQNVIEQELNGPGTQVAALRKSDLDDKFTHVKKDRCIDLLNLREAALREDAQRQRWRSSNWLATVTSPSESAHVTEGNNPFGSNWCVQPKKRSRPARPNPFSSPSPFLGYKARPMPHLRLANTSVKIRIPPPLAASALTAAAVTANTGDGVVEVSASSSSSSSTSYNGGAYFAMYAGNEHEFLSDYEDFSPYDYEVVGGRRRSPLRDLPAGFYGDEAMDEERCPKCGSVLNPDGSCEADWCNRS